VVIFHKDEQLLIVGFSHSVQEVCKIVNDGEMQCVDVSYDMQDERRNYKESNNAATSVHWQQEGDISSERQNCSTLNVPSVQYGNGAKGKKLQDLILKPTEIELKDYEMQILKVFYFESEWKTKHPETDIRIDGNGKVLLSTTEHITECQKLITKFINSMVVSHKEVSTHCAQFLLGSTVQNYINQALKENNYQCVWFVDDNSIIVYGKRAIVVTESAQQIRQSVVEETYQECSSLTRLNENYDFKNLSSSYAGKLQVTQETGKLVLVCTNDIAPKVFKKMSMWITGGKSRTSSNVCKFINYNI